MIMETIVRMSPVPWKYKWEVCSATMNPKSSELKMHDPKKKTYRTGLKQWDMDKLLKSLNNPDYANSQNLENLLVGQYKGVTERQWNSLVRELCTQGDLDAAVRVLDWVRKHRLCNSCDILYSMIISCMGKQGMMSECFNLTSALVRDGGSLGTRIHHALIGACARNRKFEKAFELVRKMKEDGLDCDFVNYSLLLQELAKQDKPRADLMMRVFREIQQDAMEMNPEILNEFVCALSRAAEPSQAVFFMGLMQNRGMSLRPASFFELIFSLVDLGRIEEADAIFQEMKICGIRPTVKVYDAMLRGLLDAGIVQGAEALVLEMEENNVVPSRTTYGILLDLYMDLGSRDEIRRILDELKQKDHDDGASDASFVLVDVLSSFRDRGEWQKVFVLLKQIRASKIPLDVYIYNVLIDTFGKFNHMNHAINAFERMMEEGLVPSEITWNTVIDLHCRAGKYENVMKLFDLMRSCGISPTCHTYNILFKSMGRQAKLDEIPVLLSQMRDGGISPDIVTYTTLVDIYGHARRFHDAWLYLEQAKAESLQPLSEVYCALINAYAQQGLSEQAADVYRIMLTEGIQPDLLILNTLLNAFAAAGKHPEAISIVDHMKRKGVQPDVVTYTTLMKALITSKRYHKVQDAYKEMLKSGCIPDRKAKDMLLFALKNRKQSSNQCVIVKDVSQDVSSPSHTSKTTNIVNRQALNSNA